MSFLLVGGLQLLQVGTAGAGQVKDPQDLGSSGDVWFTPGPGGLKRAFEFPMFSGF